MIYYDKEALNTWINVDLDEDESGCRWFKVFYILKNFEFKAMSYTACSWC